MSEHTADPARSGENQFGTAFAEADARLAAMHGYAAVCTACGEEHEGMEQLSRLEAKVDTLTTLVREIKRALSAGAIGAWGNQRDAAEVERAITRGEVPQTDGR